MIKALTSPCVPMGFLKMDRLLIVWRCAVSYVIEIPIFFCRSKLS